MRDTTVVVKTIGRSTLKYAIQSAQREGFQVVVVSDGVDIHSSDLADVCYCKLGKKFGYYGSMAQNVGALLCSTEFVTYVDDDDELAEGAGDIIRTGLQERPEVDIWIPGLLYNTGGMMCMNGPMAIGNVAVPTYRVDVFTKCPFVHKAGDHDPVTDYRHVRQCVESGYRIEWFRKPIYLVRPRLPGSNGAGLIDSETP